MRLRCKLRRRWTVAPTTGPAVPAGDPPLALPAPVIRLVTGGTTYPPQVEFSRPITSSLVTSWTDGDLAVMQWTADSSFTTGVNETASPVTLYATTTSYNFGLSAIVIGSRFMRMAAWRGSRPATLNWSNIINVGDVEAPLITSPSSRSAYKNQTISLPLTANEGVTWATTGGADEDTFTLVGDTLEAAAQTVSSLEVEVQATDYAGHTSAKQTITVTLTVDLASAVRVADFTTGTYSGITPTNVNATGGYVTSDSGVMTMIAANTLRRSDKGLLVEPAVVNRVFPSADFTAWVNTTAVADTTVAPDGTTTADTLTSGVDPTYAYKGADVGVSGGVVTASVFLKAGTKSTTTIWFTTGGFGAYVKANVSLGAGTVGTPVSSGVSSASAAIEAVTASWFRVSVSCSGLVNTDYFILGREDSGASGTVKVWGAQVELGSAPSSYFPTTGAAATRAADAVSFTVPGGYTTLVYTFDNGTMHDVSVSPGTFTIATNLSRSYIKYIDLVP